MYGKDLRGNKWHARYLNKCGCSLLNLPWKTRGLTLIRAGIRFTTDTTIDPEASLTTKGLQGLMVAMVTIRARPGRTTHWQVSTRWRKVWRRQFTTKPVIRRDVLPVSRRHFTMKSTRQQVEIHSTGAQIGWSCRSSRNKNDIFSKTKKKTPTKMLSCF